MISRVPILTYHSLDESGSVTSVRPVHFAEHMRSLARRGFHAIPLAQLTDHWRTGAALPPKPVVLTFDDGFANLLPHAAPILAELGFRATLFVVSRRCGGVNDWPHQCPSIPRLKLLTWDELRQLSRQGFEIGAHTATHPRLTDLSAAEARREIHESKTDIEQHLDVPVTTFAYPFGALNPETTRSVEEHFAAAVSVEFRTAKKSDNLHALPRLDVYYFRSPRLFRLFGTLPGRVYLALRAAGRAARAGLAR